MSRIAIDTQWVKINYEWVFLFHALAFSQDFQSFFFLGYILHHKYLMKYFKVQLFWEGHKCLELSPPWFDVYLVNIKFFVAFSEKLNFKILHQNSFQTIVWSLIHARWKWSDRPNTTRGCLLHNGMKFLLKEYSYFHEFFMRLVFNSCSALVDVPFLFVCTIDESIKGAVSQNRYDITFDGNIDVLYNF